MANNAPWQPLKTSDAVKWLRQRTNTSSANAWAKPDNAAGANAGLWSDGEIVRKLNYATRHVAALMMAADPYNPYFLRVNLQSQAQTLGFEDVYYFLLDPDELPVLAAELGFARVLYLKFSDIATNAPGGAYADVRNKPIREVGWNRLAHAARHDAMVTNDSPASSGEVTYSVEFGLGDSPSGVGKVCACTLRFYNFPAHPSDTPPPVSVKGYKFDVFFQQFPTMLDATLADPTDEHVALPPIAYNAVLRYAELLLLEDEANVVRMSLARQSWEEERTALLASMHQSFDQPGGMNEIREAAMELRGQRR